MKTIEIKQSRQFSFNASSYVTIFIITCRQLLKAVMVLLPLLGMTWIIGMFAVNNDTQVFAWIFAVLNSLQVKQSNPITLIYNI